MGIEHVSVSVALVDHSYRDSPIESMDQSKERKIKMTFTKET